MAFDKSERKFEEEIEYSLTTKGGYVNGIPDDFKFLALAESNLANVVSPSGAEGYWQFIKTTGQIYNLEINDNVDERYNIEKATILVSGRFHHTIAAACLGTNFIVLNSNTPKIDGLLQAIGNTQNIIHYNDIDLLSTLLKLSKKKQHKMKISLDQLCDKAMQNFKLLKIMATER